MCATPLHTCSQNACERHKLARTPCSWARCLPLKHLQMYICGSDEPNLCMRTTLFLGKPDMVRNNPRHHQQFHNSLQHLHLYIAICKATPALRTLIQHVCLLANNRCPDPKSEWQAFCTKLRWGQNKRRNYYISPRSRFGLFGLSLHCAVTGRCPKALTLDTLSAKLQIMALLHACQTHRLIVTWFHFLAF